MTVTGGSSVTASFGDRQPPNAAPVVSDVNASQGFGTGIVTVSYNVADNEQDSVSVTLQYWNGSAWVDCVSVTGDVGAVSTGTGRTATWDAKVDFDGEYRTDIKIKVIADDRQDDNNIGSGESPAFTLDTKAPVGYECSSPANGATAISVTPTLVISAGSDDSAPVEYYFVLATDSGFTTGVQTIGWQPSTSWTPATLDYGTQYWWKVKARDAYANEGDYASAFSFTTVVGLRGDVNRDGRVDILDLAVVAAAFGSQPPTDPAADIDRDGIVDILDLAVVGLNFGETESILPSGQEI